jgi:hypothetical protein
MHVEQVEIGDIIGDDEGFVVVERTFKNEKICVLTSTQVEKLRSSIFVFVGCLILL